jgi:signal transduction histidine kinase
MKKRVLLFTVFAALALCITAQAQGSNPSTLGPLILTDAQVEYPLGLHMQILEDPGGNLTIDQVSSPEFDSRFVPSQVEVPNYGFTGSAYWVRFRLDNETHQIDEWLLELNFANMHYADLYIPTPDGHGFEVKQTGYLRPVSTRDILYPHILFNLTIPIQSQPTYYLRFQNGASMTLPLILWTKDIFLVQSQWEQMLNWFLFGAIIALLAYHLFLLATLRERSYLYFVTLLASLLVSLLAYEGFLGVYFFPNLNILKPLYIPLFFEIFIASIILFSDAFLELRTHFPRLHRANNLFTASWGVMLLVTPFVSYHQIAVVAVPWMLVSMGLTWAAGIASWRQGFHPARFFMIAWFGMIAGFILLIVVRAGIVPSTWVNENIYRLGTIWMGVCWSIALADRINLLKTNTENANRNLRDSERRLSQILEGLPFGVVLYAKDLLPRYLNRRTVDILSDPARNIRPDPSAGRTLAQAIQYYSFKVAGSSKDYPIEKIPVSSALLGNPASTDDIEMERGDERIPLEMWASPVKDEAGNVESAVLVIQDITQRKQAEAELAEYQRHLEALVGRRTADLTNANKELRLRLEWMSAIVLVTEIMARSSDFAQIYDKIIAIINRLFAVRDSFITELEDGTRQLKILAHSCASETHLDLIGSLTNPPEGILLDSGLEHGKLVFVAKDELNAMDGPIGEHIRNAEVQGIALVPLQLREQVFGFLGLELQEQGRTITPEESSLLSIFSIDIANLIQYSRLFEQTRALITAEERNRLARDLHDSVTQTLFTASVLAEATPRIWDKDPRIARQNMEKLSLLIRGALAEMRSMLIELRSEELVDQSLDHLLITLVEAARVRTQAVISVSMIDITDLPKNVTLAFYRIGREALNNAIIHASATRINVSLLAEPGQVKLSIQDNGCGFDPRVVSEGHLGIRIMLERARGIGGDMQIHSQPGHGTEIDINWSSKTGGQ